jgi:hypothetical protein
MLLQKKIPRTRLVKSKEGVLLTNRNDQMDGWKEHMSKALNQFTDVEMENEPGVLENLANERVLTKGSSKEEIILALNVQNGGTAP